MEDSDLVGTKRFEKHKNLLHKRRGENTTNLGMDLKRPSQRNDLIEHRTLEAIQ